MHPLFETPQVLTFVGMLIGAAVAFGAYRLLNVLPIDRPIGAAIVSGLIGGAAAGVVADLFHQEFGYARTSWFLAGDILAGTMVLMGVLGVWLYANRRRTMAGLALMMVLPLYLVSLYLVRSTTPTLEEIGVAIWMSLVFSSVTALALKGKEKVLGFVAIGSAALAAAAPVYILLRGLGRPFGIQVSIWLLAIGVVGGFAWSSHRAGRTSLSSLLWIVWLVIAFLPIWLVAWTAASATW